MSRRNTLATAVLIAATALGTGCVVRAHGRVAAPVAYVEIEEEPPPPQVVVVPAPRAGFIWVSGRWVHHGGRYHWRDGYWERERVGYFYEQGRWERRGRGHVWVEGSWRGGGNNNRNDNVRDHRDNRGNDHRGNDGPRVRDHRH
jgi:hypothetical protein